MNTIAKKVTRGVVLDAFSEIRSVLKFNRHLSGDKGAFLRKMCETESIFIHIPKTAGKSIFQGLYGIGLHESFGHAGVDAYLSILGPRKFNKFFKFAFVRNPWDRLYSAFRFASNGSFGSENGILFQNEIKDMTFSEFVKDWLDSSKVDKYIILKPQSDFVCDSAGDLLLDKVCYFENIDNEYRELCLLLGKTKDMPHINKSQSTSHYQDVYDSEMIDVVLELYAVDIELFGYGFNGKTNLIDA